MGNCGVKMAGKSFNALLRDEPLNGEISYSQCEA